MKGIVLTDFGLPQDVLQIKEVEKPIAKNNQVIVRVRASSLNITDYMPFKAPLDGKEVPPHIQHMYAEQLKAVGRVLGMDIAGVVESVGEDVTSVAPGDEVYGFTYDWLGGWAEYACANESDIAKKPANLSFEEAAVIPTVGLVALGGVRLADVKPGQKVLIQGASGGVGSLMVSFLNAFGAKITGVCSTRNVETVYNAGAERVIDYTKENVADCGENFDCIFAVNGYQSVDTYLSLLKPGGILVAIGGTDQQIMEIHQFGAEKFKDTDKRMASVSFATVKRELPFITELVENGKITPVIDKIYPVQEVSAAVTDIVNNHSQGKLSIKIDF